MLIHKKLLILIGIVCVSIFSLQNTYGHGVGYEVLPPVMLGGSNFIYIKGFAIPSLHFHSSFTSISRTGWLTDLPNRKGGGMTG